jgi:hypothetical protein
MMINRCLGRAGLASPRLGKPTKNGNEAAEMPSCLMNCRRWIAFIPIDYLTLTTRDRFQLNKN